MEQEQLHTMHWAKAQLAFGIGMLALETGLIAADAANVAEASLDIHAMFTVAGLGMVATATSRLWQRRQQSSQQ